MEMSLKVRGTGNRSRVHILSGLGLSCCAAHLLLYGLGSLAGHARLPLLGVYAAWSLVFFFAAMGGGLTLLILQGKEAVRRAILASTGWLCLWTLVIWLSLRGEVGNGIWILSSLVGAGSAVCLWKLAPLFNGIRPWRTSYR